MIKRPWAINNIIKAMAHAPASFYRIIIVRTDTSKQRMAEPNPNYGEIVVGYQH